MCKKVSIKVSVIGRGAPDYIEFIEDYARTLGVEHVIEVVGYVEDTREWYLKSDIVVMASRLEAFGRVTVEAMMSGCLVVGADSGGTSEIISNGITGILYDASKKNDLLDKLEYAVWHKEISRQIAENGRQFVKSNFSALRNADEVYKVYKLYC